MAISSNELRELYQTFFESKGHMRIPSAPLVPENDPSVLFTTAGMHPLVPYLKGQPHPSGNRLVDVQKCLRTTDIEEVGDATHATVFEMLGNWSLGDYFKPEAISWSWEFLTSKNWLNLNPDYLAVSVFAGDSDSTRDEESAHIWKSLGVPHERIAYLSKEDNWWPAGGKHPGPQGPDTEMFYWSPARQSGGQLEPPRVFDPRDSSWVEIWNDVFMQYNRTPAGGYEDLPQKNVDTGMGLERTVMVLNSLKSMYDIDTFEPLLALINEHAQRDDIKQKRILADHIKAFTFVLGDEAPVTPSNTDQGYVARRIIRRAMLASQKLNVGRESATFLLEGMNVIIQQYKDAYPSLKSRGQQAATALKQEVEKFSATLDRGLLQFNQMLHNGKTLSGIHAFELYTTYGFPIDMTLELAAERAVTVDLAGFQAELEEEMKKHQGLSRTAAAGKFKGGLVDHSEQSIHYHTATHLLHQALRTILGNHVFQKGSNITPERLRFDFSHPEKMTADQIKAVEDLVNQKIQTDLPVKREEMTVAEAKQKGALGLFEHKYGEKVSVYTMGNFSCEICGGPHVAHTGVLGHFTIRKEEALGSGIRRIKAVLE